ncbi:MAG: sigma-70 family RNA polymerase sigma factor [Planctomycetota bacterium]|nr:sigma-70 family RNA polymerase sigma factor [Planctomycetota bacterium]
MTSIEAMLETPKRTGNPPSDSGSESVNVSLDGVQRQRIVTEYVERFHDDIYRFAYRLTGDSDWSDDIVQSTFLKAFERLEQLKDAQKAKSWLLAIARTTFLGDLRKRRAWVFTDAELDGAQLPNANLDPSVDTARLQNALLEMPEQFRIVVVMHYLQQESYREIAEQLEIPMGTVMSRLSRAKKMLKSKLIALKKQNDQ